FAVSIVLLWRRGEVLHSDNELDSLLSREAAFLLNNVIFISIAFVTFLGTHFPLFSELVTGQKVTVGPPWYNQIIGPQLAVLVLLMGVAPLIAWRKASLKTLGRLIWIPAALTVPALIVY